ncbi:MAG: hypothetical protein KAJ19_19350, partial [Gammaproteobacteria bacterium]|nr:hypothetical protein [Gammaproteobacteria bacterium]
MVTAAVAGSTLGAISANISIASAVFGAASALSQASAQKRLASRNAAISEQNAIQVKNEAAFEESVKRSETQRLKASQRALQGASGGGVDTGSSLLVLEEQAVAGELDALTIRYKGEVGATRARNQAGTDRFEGQIAKQTGIFKAGTSLLSG